MKRAEHHAAADRRLLEYIGIEYPYKRPASRWHLKPAAGKILVMADPHNPYYSTKVERAAETREHDAETVIIPGDVGDYYSKSRFRKTKAVSFREEVYAIFKYLEWLSTKWRTVKIMIGNHDNRPEKAVQDIMGKDVDLMIMTEANLLENLASFFDNIEIVGTQIEGEPLGEGRRHKINLTHIYQHGDIVFTHGERSMEQASALMAKISVYLYRWRTMLRLKPYRIIAQAHNHADYRASMGAEKWIQLPAACEPVSLGMEYIFGTRMQGNPPMTGYAIFYQDKGETDYNASRNIIL